MGDTPTPRPGEGHEDAVCGDGLGGGGGGLEAVEGLGVVAQEAAEGGGGEVGAVAHVADGVGELAVAVVVVGGEDEDSRSRASTRRPFRGRPGTLQAR